jgi:hypothetical protein
MDNSASEVTLVKNPLAILWIGRATIYEFETVTDPVTFKSKQQLTPVVKNEPCRVSYANQTHGELISTDKGVTNIEQEITLFIRPDLTIKPGTVIEVTQHNRTVKYKCSTKSALYSNHQEISLELFEDYA